MDQTIKNHALQSLKKGIRYDGRTLSDYRNIEVKYGASETAEGSAQVKIGDTEVIAGVKMALEKPYPDTPNVGSLMIGVELLPLSSPEFESGPPSIQAIELARVIDRGIRESGAIDTKKLCVEPGEKVWLAAVDICIINDAGNLFDACALATIAALKNAKMPAIVDNAVDYTKKTDEDVPLTMTPISVTVLKIDGQYLVDPSHYEEKILDARLSVASTEEGDVCAMQKGGVQPLTDEDLDKMMTLAIEKAQLLRSKL